MFVHGAQKLNGWFGEPGLEASIDGFRQFLGMPTGIAPLVILAEVFGSLGLPVGFLMAPIASHRGHGTPGERTSGLEQAALHRQGDGLGTIFGPELVQDRGGMELDRPLTDAERAGDLLAR